MHNYWHKIEGQLLLNAPRDPSSTRLRVCDSHRHHKKKVEGRSCWETRVRREEGRAELIKIETNTVASIFYIQDIACEHKETAPPPPFLHTLLSSSWLPPIVALPFSSLLWFFLPSITFKSFKETMNVFFF